MDIKVLGPGCPKCESVEKNAREAVDEVGVEATISKVTKLAEIMEYDVVMTPALVINGKVKVSGRVPGKDELKGWIKEEG